MAKRLVLVPKPDPRRVSRLLRVAGTLVLVAGLGVSSGLYWRGTRHAEPSIEELLPGASAANARQMRLLYGHSVYAMMEYYRELQKPGPQAVVVIVVAGVAAAGLFRVAWLRDPRNNAH